MSLMVVAVSAILVRVVLVVRATEAFVVPEMLVMVMARAAVKTSRAHVMAAAAAAAVLAWATVVPGVQVGTAARAAAAVVVQEAGL